MTQAPIWFARWHRSAHIVVVQLGGCVDFVTAEALDQTIQAAMKEGCYRIVVDLSAVDYISSMGWSVFLHHLKALRERRGDLKLAGMRPGVYEVYRVLEFDWFLEHYAAVELACAACLALAPPTPAE